VPAISQIARNNIVWTISLLLQILLVAALFTRKIPRRLPAFTALVAFYPLRAALLFALYGHLPPDRYASLYAALSTLDLLLQAAVAVEITIGLLRELGGWTLPRAGLILLLLVIAHACTTALLTQLPAHTPIPVDRPQTFLSFLMLTFFVWTTATSRSPLLRPVTLGLALYASVSLAAQTGRITAAIHRDAQAYARWSYTSAAGYLIVVALWLLTLELQPDLTPESPAAP
jgi:hypothetical protein